MALNNTQIADRLRANLAAVQDRLAAAARRAGRTGQARLVAVTKYVEPQIARILLEIGVSELGESRPQELWRKAEALADLPEKRKIAWHLIGHLQRNKVRRTLPLVALIQSVDSLRLLDEISREAVAQDVIADVLLEVNTSGDVAKHGFQPGEIEPLLPEIFKLPLLRVRGLMTMASLAGGPDRARRDFAALRELRERLQPSCHSNVQMDELSMGMSGDFEEAIEEGATMVRVGSALFEGIA